MKNNVLKRVKISGFKSIRCLDLELNSLNILIGANGSGKSNFIKAFKFLNQIINQNLEFFVAKSGGANTFLYFGQKTTQQIKFSWEFSPYSYKVILEVSADGKLIFAQEQIDYINPLNSLSNDLSYPIGNNINLGRGHFETKLSINQSPDNIINSEYIIKCKKNVVNAIKSWKIYHFHDTSDTRAISF